MLPTIYTSTQTDRSLGYVKNENFLFQKANMALAPIHIRREREKYVSFTRTYLDLGLTILMARERSDRHLFSILEPFKWDLWIAVVGSMFAVGVAVTICSCFSPYGYHGRHVQRVTRDDGQYKEQSKTFNLYNGLWFAFASFIQQVSDEGYAH